MKVGQLGLELDQRVAGAGDIAGAAGADAVLCGGLGHGRDHLGVTAHTKVVVGAPDGHVLGLAAGSVPDGGWEMFGTALEIGEHSVAAFRFQLANGVGEVMAIAHLNPMRCDFGLAPPQCQLR